MRIKQLELIGFKSFPQRATLEIPPGITAVVGPNGCGKSNVVDAIRWVLGEQSAKHLRGDGMEAVVFNGNERVAPLGMAEVSLTFDNDGPVRPKSEFDAELSCLPEQFRDLAEIRVTRRYFRSGESEYFINSTACRLKDITELFLGTGVGSKAYGIIEQGRVEKLIDAKSEDRRLLIEEAAGTTLYRSRKLAAQRKMDRTRENLDRVNDVLREIDRQIGYLRRQAKKAETYRRLQEEVRSLELRLAGDQWRRLQQQQSDLDTARQRLKEEEREIGTALEVAERGQVETAQALARAERRHMEAREALAVLDAERESLRERLGMLEQEGERSESRRERMSADLETAVSRGRELEVELARVEQEREQWTGRLVEEQAVLALREEEFAAARLAVTAAQESLEEAKSALVAHMTSELEMRNAVARLESRREENARQFTKLRTEEVAVEDRMREIERQVGARRGDVEALRARLATAAGEKETLADRMRSLEEKRRHWEREVNALESSLVQARSRLESLEEIQQNYEGFEPAVQMIMREEHHPDGVIGVVADVIEIPQEFERATAAVLGDRLQYMIVEGEEAGANAVGRLRREATGRGSFIPVKPRLEADRLSGAASMNESSRLLDLIRVEGRFEAVAESLLGEVVLVPNLESGLELWRRNGVFVTFVTREGDVITPSGVISGGSDRPVEEEILGRRREIDGLRAELFDTATRLDVARGELAEVQEEIEQSGISLQSLGQGVHELTVEIVAAEKDIERLELERPQCASRRDVVRYERETVLGDDQAVVRELGESRETLETLTSEHEAFEANILSQRAVLSEATERGEALGGAVTAAKVQVAENAQRSEAAAAGALALRRQRQELSTREANLTTELRAAEQERASREQAIADGKAREGEQLERRGQLMAGAQEAEGEVERLASTREAEEQSVRQTRGRLEGVRGRCSEIDLERSEIRLRAEHLAQTIMEKHRANLAEQGLGDQDQRVDEADAERLEVLKEQLGRIGEVNVGAIEELRELEERGGFLRNQREDLERSLADLERTIQKLNRVSRSRFAETFARANETFQKVFPRLFRGGEGRLVLTDENNLLETGVDIVVRPPGKRLDNMMSLSGGEKALVAVSLIFSLFLINPSPFCILDEVDAPLDDANIGRFGQMIREMSERVQFLIITHNKRTMEAADILYGVTMQEPGVSKLVSVELK